jgi:hypothetical protein
VVPESDARVPKSFASAFLTPLSVSCVRDKDQVLDLASVEMNGQRYGIQTDRNRIESQWDTWVRAIVGVINGGQAQGRAVRVPRDSVLDVRIQAPIIVGVADAGSRWLPLPRLV